jgi:hypothetical protein
MTRIAMHSTTEHLRVGVFEEGVEGGQHMVRHIFLREAPGHRDQHTRHSSYGEGREIKRRNVVAREAKSEAGKAREAREIRNISFSKGDVARQVSDL